MARGEEHWPDGPFSLAYCVVLTTGGSLPPVASPLDRGVQIQLARYPLDGRTRPVDVALRLAARGSSAPGNDAGRSAWNTNARAPRRPRPDELPSRRDGDVALTPASMFGFRAFTVSAVVLKTRDHQRALLGVDGGDGGCHGHLALDGAGGNFAGLGGDRRVRDRDAGFSLAGRTHLDDERLVIPPDHWGPHLQSVELLWILHRRRQRAALRPHEGHGALVLVDRFDGAMHRHRRDLTHSRLDAGRLRRRDRRRRPRHCPEREGDSDGQRHDRRGYSKNVLHHDALLERTGVHRSGRTLGGRSTVDDGTLGVRRRTLGPWSYGPFPWLRFGLPSWPWAKRSRCCWRRSPSAGRCWPRSRSVPPTTRRSC